MRTTAWIFRRVLFPLVAFLIGAMLRCVHQGGIHLDCFSPPELSFAMAMLCMLMIINASQLENKHLKDTVIYGFVLGVAVFLAFFAWAVFLQAEIESSLNSAMTVAQEHANKGTLLPGHIFDNRVEEFNMILARIRLSVILLALVIVPVSLIVSIRYDVEKL